MQNHGLGTHNNKQFLLIAHPKVPQLPHNLFGPSAQFEKILKTIYVCRYIFFNLGDTVHLIVGNHNHSYVALGGIWILGGIGSLGDIALDPRAITGQVSNISEDFFFLFTYPCKTKVKKI